MSLISTQKIWIAVCVVLLAAGAVMAQADADAEARTYTNADLASLPAPGNDSLPTLETAVAKTEQGGNTESAAPATTVAKPAAGVAPVQPNPESMQWLQGRIDRMRLDQAIDGARRKLTDATAEVARLRSVVRPEGSAFAQGGESAEARYVRGVADPMRPLSSALEEARARENTARAELDRLLTQSSGG